MSFKRSLFRLVAALAIFSMAFALLPAPLSARAATAELFFSEYIEGSSNNKALEIYNGTGAAINLGTSGYNIQMFFNGSTSAGLTINLTGTVADGDVFIIAQSSSVAAILAQADQTNGAGWYNGDDAVVLRKGTAVIDVIGQIGFDPGSEWGSGLTSTADNTLRRKASVQGGDDNGGDAFDPSVQWDGFATDTFDGLGFHTIDIVDSAPIVSSVTPANGAVNVTFDTNINVAFSEGVNLADGWYSLSCTLSGVKTAVVSGGPAAYTIDPDADFVAGETCTFTVLAAYVTDVDADDPPDSMVDDYSVSFTTPEPNACDLPFTPIYEIQGSGPTVALTGTRTTEGVVVGDYEGPSPTQRGFFIQDPAGDNDPATSDGIFVYNASRDSVSLGDYVRVTGDASEYQGQSQITTSSSGVIPCGTGTVVPTDVTLPFPTADYLERYEGMLVRLPQTLYVTEHFQLGRFGQVVMSSGGRLQQPTNMVEPGAPALALQEQNNLNRIIIDDASQLQNPDPILFARDGQPLSASNTLRGGDTATGIVGVLNYTWGGHSSSPNAYRVRPVNALNGYYYFEAANPRPVDAPAKTGDVRVAGMNLLNFFNSWTNCYPSGTGADCRGAENQPEYDRQLAKTVAAIVGTQADVIGVIEIENDGYGPDSALAALTDALNAATATGTYAYVDVDTNVGQEYALGGDAIKVGFLYKPGVVSLVGQTAVLNSEAFINGGDDEPRNRAALAQAFQHVDGGVFVASVNHLKSKGSACDAPDGFDGQGNCNQVRLNAALLLGEWLASDPTGVGDMDALIVGDLNSYAKEDPIIALEDLGFTNLIEAFLGPDAYSYVFDGQWGYLDHALASPSLVSQVANVAEWHINADEPSVLDYNTNFKSATQINSLYAPDEFRISDHDPVLVDLALEAPPTVDAGGPYSVVEYETVTLSATATDPNGLEGLEFAWDLDNDGSFETPGQSVDFVAPAATATLTVRVQVTDPTGFTATDEATIYVRYNFQGFFHSYTNPPEFNLANAGSTQALFFSLASDKGMDILASQPTVQRISCTTGEPVGAASLADGKLVYDYTDNWYLYSWKTVKNWKGTCQMITFSLADGTQHSLWFKFTK